MNRYMKKIPSYSHIRSFQYLVYVQDYDLPKGQISG